MPTTLANDLAWESTDYWRGEMATYGPDDDDGDGETDDCPTPIVIVTPWDVDGGDDDRRRAEWDAGFQAGRNGGECERQPSWSAFAYLAGFAAGQDELARVEAAALASYDNWLTCAEWDALDQLTRYFGRLSFDGVTAYVPAILRASHLRWWVERIGLSHLPHTECVFGGGLAVRIKGAAQWQ